MSALRVSDPVTATSLARDLWDSGYDVTLAAQDPCVLVASDAAATRALAASARCRAIPLHPTP